MNQTSLQFFDIIDATWPAARIFRDGPWTLREGRGGGKRVSAATVETPVDLGDIEKAERAMRALGQAPLFMVRDGEKQLDRLLEVRGYSIIDPVVIYACPSRDLTGVPLPRVSVFSLWEPLAIMREIWAKGGIGPARVDVMMRAKPPRTGFLGRFDDKPAAAAFAAVHDGTAMVHALEVLPGQRRKGVAKWVMRAAAFWAVDNGADTLAVIVTLQNRAGNALYTSLGMKPVGKYHYRHVEIGV